MIKTQRATGEQKGGKKKIITFLKTCLCSTKDLSLLELAVTPPARAPTPLLGSHRTQLLRPHVSTGAPHSTACPGLGADAFPNNICKLLLNLGPFNSN